MFPHWQGNFLEHKANVKQLNALKEFPSSVYFDGMEKRVKNLGWILRNWQRVKHFTIRTEIVRDGVVVKFDGALLIAWLHGGGCYSSGWAGDKDWVLEWLSRPVFRGLTVVLDPPKELDASKLEQCPAELCRTI